MTTVLLTEARAHLALSRDLGISPARSDSHPVAQRTWLPADTGRLLTVHPRFLRSSLWLERQKPCLALNSSRSGGTPGSAFWVTTLGAVHGTLGACKIRDS
jgi:hypothetical protein